MFLLIRKHFVVYENILLLDDFNSKLSENTMTEFCKVYKLKVPIKGASCYESPEKSTCIDSQ